MADTEYGGMIDIANIVRKYIDIVKKEISVQKVILYGSYSKGFPRQDSDIDLAIISNDFTGDIIEDRLKLMKLRRSVDIRIEPCPFLPEDFDDSNPFVREIIDTGKVIETF